MARAERSVEKASPERETFHVKAQVQGGRGQRKKKKEEVLKRGENSGKCSKQIEWQFQGSEEEQHGGSPVGERK